MAKAAPKKNPADIGHCGDCGYWDNTSSADPNLGICRRNPPIPSPSLSVQGLFPLTTGDVDWCGYYDATFVPPAPVP